MEDLDCQTEDFGWVVYVFEVGSDVMKVVTEMQQRERARETDRQTLEMRRAKGWVWKPTC